jgi:hypothetical protein
VFLLSLAACESGVTLLPCCVWKLLRHADPTVLLRVLDLLELFCTRLQRNNGLISEGYTPARGKAPWTPAPDTHINYGEAGVQATGSIMMSRDAAVVLAAFGPVRCLYHNTVLC